jgi:hypothetical protein
LASNVYEFIGFAEFAFNQACLVYNFKKLGSGNGNKIFIPLFFLSVRREGSSFLTDELETAVHTL